MRHFGLLSTTTSKRRLASHSEVGTLIAAEASAFREFAPLLPMDVLWMQNFLGLAQCDVPPCSSNTPSNCAPLNYDDFEVDTDALFEFSCPFCYLEYDIGSLCSHLEEEHGTESKSVICPVCAAKSGPDIVGHITHQHAHLFKISFSQLRARKSSSSSSTSFSLDPLLSSLLNGFSFPESDATSKDSKEAPVTSTDRKVPSLGAAFKTEIWEHNVEEATNRAKFVQQMVLSTVFRED
ncbi:hypothetical protein GOP47_0012413 [Adiantum capillus-veneris]|uniref:Drought induced 19 protein type zinc-binding domain-containing protein n=1 Tax=Adiantum capillus-veneris TaxID=13818 RepID=A0A9D4ZFN7_ADICA|nr:hypothetical protein GOP47_0012413 [Adiantum capillus-veneris]